MKQLLYVGKFSPWNDTNEDNLYEALETFDKVIIAVMLNDKQTKPKKGQPTKILNDEMKARIDIVYYKKLKALLKDFKECKYIMFER